MRIVITGVYEGDGVLKLAGPVQLEANTRVRVILVPEELSALEAQPSKLNPEEIGRLAGQLATAKEEAASLREQLAGGFYGADIHRRRR